MRRRCRWGETGRPVILAAILFLVLLGLGSGVHARAQGQAWIAAHYTKQERLVPMRDGVRLFTSIYAPKAVGRYPFLVERTPYGAFPYGRNAFPETLGPSDRFAREGFIFVVQDVRGRYRSEGTFVDMRPLPGEGVDESTDAWDTLQWLLAHVPNHNGLAGQWGISYPGFYTLAGMVRAHPALVATSPQAPIVDWFAGDDFHRNGALWLPHLFNFISWFGQERPRPSTRRAEPYVHRNPVGRSFYLGLGPLDRVNARYFRGRVPFWDDVVRHGTYDAFWKARNIRPHLQAIQPSVLLVGGWFDGENLFGTLQTFQSLGRQSPNTPVTLVMGPWFHGAWHTDSGEWLGSHAFGSRTSVFYQDEVLLPFFMHHLKGGPPPGLPKALVFETGFNRWVRMGSWPPEDRVSVRLFFQPGGRMGLAQPTGGPGSSRFLSDPADPVPSFQEPQTGMPLEYMVSDQRFVAHRPDVLTFRSPVLSRDLEVAGPVRVKLWVSTTGTDADWVVKVIDEHPAEDSDGLAGHLSLVRGEVMRGKFRQDLSRPVPFIPGVPTPVEWSLNDVFHAFRRGHRLVVQIQSSWFPLMDRNPQTFLDIYTARARDFRPASHHVYHTPAWPSAIEVPVWSSGKATGQPDYWSEP